MMKHIVTTIAVALLASSAFGQSVLKDELKSLKDKKEAAYQQAEQAKLDQIAVVNKKYFEVLKQLLLKAKVSNAKDNELIWGIKRELADLGHFEPEDWYFGTWSLSTKYTPLSYLFKIDFDGTVSQIDPKTREPRVNFAIGKIEVQSDSKVKFKHYRETFEVQKVAAGRSNFTLVTERSKTEHTGIRE